jgi:mRNA interferase HigB
MRVIGRPVLEGFSKRHPQAKRNLDAWYQVTKDANWGSIVEVRRVYPSADFVSGLTVFNISGNKYRLIADIFYKQQIASIKYVLTHAEYTKGKWKP